MQSTGLGYTSINHMQNSTILKFFLGTCALLIPALAHADFKSELTSSLVQRSGESLQTVDADALNGKKYIAVYYSAHWCPPCRQFTPYLSRFYDEMVKAHPEFELIFVSSDRSASAMAEYMNWGKMNFLAVDFDKARSTPLRQHSARGIPYLIVLDAEGNVLLQKDAGEDWTHPAKILPKLKKLLEG